MMNRKRFRRSKRPRRGVTLVELIVASTILMLGLLSIVGISASVARALGESRNESLAAMAAQSRFEEIAGTNCTTFTLNSVFEKTNRNITERYVILDAGNNTRLLKDTVSWKTSRLTRQAIFETLIPCRPGG